MSNIAVITGATGGLGKAIINGLVKEDIDEITASINLTSNKQQTN